MRKPGRHLLFATALAVALALLPAVASSAGPSVEAVNVGLYSHYWSPSQVSVGTGGTVTLSNSTEVPHGVEWRSALKPTCEEGAGKVPVGTTATASGAKWSGTCTFTQPGTYTFYCTVHGPEMTGTITVKNPGEPIATSEAATAVSETGATLHGTVNPEGHETTYFFRYGRTTSYENTPTPAQRLTSTSSPEAVSAPLTSLSPGTVYHFQLVAENSAGTVHGTDQTFTTASPPGPPTATTGVVTAPSETAATLKGTVNPDGLLTEYLFEWGTTTSYGHLTSELPVGEDRSVHSVSATLAGLAPGTVYHFRLVAKNGAGPSMGADGQFTTTTPPPPSPAPTSPSPAPPTTGTQPPATVSPPLTLTSKPEGPLQLSSAFVAGSLKLTAPRHGSSVRVSLQVAQAGAGGRLQVDLLAKSASLAAARGSGSKPLAVGRLVRQSVSAGKLSLAVALTARAKHALTRRHSLPLTVKITLTPTQGAAETLTRSVTLRS